MRSTAPSPPTKSAASSRRRIHAFEGATREERHNRKGTRGDQQDRHGSTPQGDEGGPGDGQEQRREQQGQDAQRPQQRGTGHVRPLHQKAEGHSGKECQAGRAEAQRQGAAQQGERARIEEAREIGRRDACRHQPQGRQAGDQHEQQGRNQEESGSPQEHVLELGRTLLEALAQGEPVDRPCCGKSPTRATCSGRSTLSRTGICAESENASSRSISADKTQSTKRRAASGCGAPLSESRSCSESESVPWPSWSGKTAATGAPRLRATLKSSVSVQPQARSPEATRVMT